MSKNDLGRARELVQKGGSLTPPYAEPGDIENASVYRPGLALLAVKNGAREMLRFLLDCHCDPNIGERGLTYIGASQPLLGSTAQPAGFYQRPQPAAKCKTPLIAAAEAGDLEMANLLLDHGAYAPATDEFQRNAVDAAAPELAKHLEQRARLQLEAEKLFVAIGRTPSSKSDLKTLERIAAETPEAFSVPNARGVTALSFLTERLGEQPSWEMHMNSIDRRVMEILATLHRSGIRLAGLDFYGSTPLHRSVVYAKAEDAAELVKIGFDPKLPDRRGKTAFDLVEGILDPKQRAETRAALKNEPAPESSKSSP